VCAIRAWPSFLERHASGCRRRWHPARDRWRREDVRIVEAINDWVARYGEAPTRIDWDRHMSRRRGHRAKLARLQVHPSPLPTPTPVLARFGSWEAALAAAGHRPRYATYRPNPMARAQTAALYASGLPIAKIAERLEVDRKTVRERLDRAGVKRRPRRQAASARLPELQERAILAGLAKGATTPELARQYGLSRSTIEVIRKRPRVSGGRVMRIVRAAPPERDVDEHLSRTEAARRLGLAPSTVDTHLSAIAARLAGRASETDP
jgi:DNA-binding NarL/FixJ family response regulator